jgi:integrase
MAIQVYCVSCRNSYELETKRCTKCGKALDRSKKYRVTVSVKGQRKTTILPNLTLARETEAALKADMLRGELDIQNPKAAPTLDDVWEKYLPWAKEHKKTWKDDDYHYGKHLKPRFGKKRLDSISPIDVERMKSELKKGLNKNGKPYAAATIKHMIVLLNHLFNLAMKWGMYQGPNPVKSVEMPKVYNQITEYLSDEELSRLLAVLEAWPCIESANFVRLALYTGIRRGEVFKLEWRDVDFDRALLTLRDPKGGPTQIIPLSEEALTLLKSIEHTDSPFLFPGKDGGLRTDFKGPWLKIRKAAGLPERFRFQGLRHNFASTLISNGVDLAVVGKLLTHKQAQTTMRYAHLRPDVVRQAALQSGKLLTSKSSGEHHPQEKSVTKL